jgi:Family of unknown function (DUF6049)
VALALSLLAPLVPTRAGAQQQDPSPVRLTLVDQSAFATPGQGVRLSVEATNNGVEPIGNLEISVSIYNPTLSRSEFEQSLEADPQRTLIEGRSFGVSGTLDPGASRTLAIQWRPLNLLAREENALHPMTVQLASEGAPLGLLRTVLVYVNERPALPLNVSLTFVLDERASVRPGGALADDRMERSLQPGGRLETIVSTIEQIPIPVTLVVAPLTLDQLDRMSRGYRVIGPGGARDAPAGSPEAERARLMLERIRGLARNETIDVVPLPLASPSVPALVAAGLTRDLESQIVRGRDLASGLLGVPLATALFRPPDSALSNESLEVLARLGVETLLVDPGTLPPPPGLILSPPATAVVDARSRGTVGAVTPDPGIDSMLGTDTADPALRAQWVIGALSAIYFEQPGVDRGAAIMFGEDDAPDPELLRALFLRLRRASPDVSPRTAWLRPVKASRLALTTEPLDERVLVPAPVNALSPTFQAELRRARGAIEQFESVTNQAGPLVERLKTLLLTSEGAHFTEDERLGLAFLRAVRRGVNGEFGKIRPPSGTPVTLTSNTGNIPITITNSTGYSVRLRVTLLSPRLEFLHEGDSRVVVLDRPRQALSFPVLAQTTGRFPVRILLRTPRGARISESRIVVRSTALNARALLVTIAAALFLLFLWVRRLVFRGRP